MNRSLTALALLTLLTTPLRAQGPSVSVGARLSTLGFGGDVALGLTPNLEARLSGNLFSLNRDFDWSDVTYGADLDLRSAAALLDLYAGPLRLTAGGMWNGNKLAGSATPIGTVQIGDTTYSDADIGTLTAAMDFRKLAPYLGLGLGSRGKIGFFLDLGVVLQGSPDITYTATTSLSGAAKTFFDQQVQREIANIDDDLRWFKWYPVVGLGLRIKLK